MKIKQKFVLQDCAKKIIDDEYKLTKADMQAELRDIEDMSGVARAGVTIGDIKAEVVMVEGSESPDGMGDAFLEFLSDKGYIIATPDPKWKEQVFYNGQRVIWRDTGEVVPGAFVKRTAPYAKVSSIKRGKVSLKRADLPQVLEAAAQEGLIGGEMPLLGGAE